MVSPRNLLLIVLCILAISLLIAPGVQSQTDEPGIPLSICPHNVDLWKALEMRPSAQLVAARPGTKTLHANSPEVFANFLSTRGEPLYYWGIKDGKPFFAQNQSYVVENERMLPMYEILATDAQGNVVDRYELWYNAAERAAVYIKTSTHTGPGGQLYPPQVYAGFGCTWIVPRQNSVG